MSEKFTEKEIGIVEDVFSEFLWHRMECQSIWEEQKLPDGSENLLATALKWVKDNKALENPSHHSDYNIVCVYLKNKILVTIKE